MLSEIQLRPVEPGDLPSLFQHQRDEAAVRMAAFTSRDHQSFHAHWAKLLADDTVIARTIRVDGELAGHVASFTREGKREVGYWIGQPYWGRGIASKALTQFLPLEKARPLYGVVAGHNAASIRVLRKCGFTLVHCADDAPRRGTGETVVLLFELR